MLASGSYSSTLGSSPTVPSDSSAKQRQDSIQVSHENKEDEFTGLSNEVESVQGDMRRTTLFLFCNVLLLAFNTCFLIFVFIKMIGFLKVRGSVERIEWAVRRQQNGGGPEVSKSKPQGLEMSQQPQAFQKSIEDRLRDFLNYLETASENEKLLNRVSETAEKTLEKISAKCALIIESIEKKGIGNADSQNQTQLEPQDFLPRESGGRESVAESRLVKVKYTGEEDSKSVVFRDNFAEYFYVVEQDRRWMLYVLNHILDQRPRQEYEMIVSKFFEIEKVENPDHYELKEPAMVDWNESEGKGSLKKKGEIRQVRR